MEDKKISLDDIIEELDNNFIKPIKNSFLEDELQFNEYDLVYIGAGTENNQKLIINHLNKYKDNIKEAIENNKFFFITGNSIELFGQYIMDKDNKYNTLGIFNYYTESVNKRLIDESIMKCDFLNNIVIGFQNQNSIMKNIDYPLFTQVKGINNEKEGIKYKNFYGTYLLGPILARNPELLTYMIKSIVLSKNKDFNFKEFDLKLNEEAYKCFINNFYQNIN